MLDLFWERDHSGDLSLGKRLLCLDFVLPIQGITQKGARHGPQCFFWDARPAGSPPSKGNAVTLPNRDSKDGFGSVKSVAAEWVTWKQGTATLSSWTWRWGEQWHLLLFHPLSSTVLLSACALTMRSWICWDFWFILRKKSRVQTPAFLLAHEGGCKSLGFSEYVRQCCKPLLGQLSFEVDNLARTDLHKLPYCG